MKHIIVICEYGWILCGYKATATTKETALTEACVVRSWRNGRGIGGLAKEKYKDDYTLDEIGEVAIKNDKILFIIPCEW